MTTQSRRTFSFLAPFQVTLFYTAISLTVYALESYFGVARNLVKIYSLGAFSPEAVVSFDQWWRVPLAPFLHYDLTHLLSALAVLLTVGMLCERRLGSVGILVCYFLGSVLPMLVVGTFYAAGLPNDAMLFGASYAALSILGFLLRRVLSSLGRKVTPLSWRKRALGAALLVVAAWYCWHRYLPFISFQGHLTALLTGYVILPLIFRAKRREIQGGSKPDPDKVLARAA